MANELNDNIKFTLELPNNNQLPFLDTMVSSDREIKQFSTALYIKPIDSLCITPWDSHGSIASKRAILIGETKRAIACSTDHTSRQEPSGVTKLFVDNKYPRKFVRNVIRRSANSNSTRDEENRYIYLKLPFINEEFKRRAQAVVRRSGISNIRLQYRNGTPSAREFAPPKQKLNCMEECETCKSGKKSKQC